MSHFYIHGDGQYCRLKAYGATVKGKVATLNVTIEVTDTYELSYILKRLEELFAAQDAKKAASAAVEPRKKGGRKALGHQPMLALPSPRTFED